MNTAAGLLRTDSCCENFAQLLSAAIVSPELSFLKSCAILGVVFLPFLAQHFLLRSLEALRLMADAALRVRRTGPLTKVHFLSLLYALGFKMKLGYCQADFFYFRQTQVDV